MSVDGNRASPRLCFCLVVVWGFFHSFTHSVTLERLNDQKGNLQGNLCLYPRLQLINPITENTEIKGNEQREWKKKEGVFGGQQRAILVPIYDSQSECWVRLGQGLGGAPNNTVCMISIPTTAPYTHATSLEVSFSTEIWSSFIHK